MPLPAFRQGGWLGLVHQPLVRELASFESRNRRTGLKEQGCVSGLETVCPQVQFAATPRILNFSDHRRTVDIHKARRQTRHLAESLCTTSRVSFIHIIHIAGEKSYLFGSWEVYCWGGGVGRQRAVCKGGVEGVFSGI